MTEKLYNVRPVMSAVTAVVRDCRAVPDGFDVLLDKTIIFPEGGGQPADGGTVGAANILHAREDGDEVWHLVDGQLAVGGSVEIKLDTERRRDHSVQHTGEHVFSGLASKLFGAVNVGFHMAEDYMTCDFDLPLDAAQLARLELEANRAIWRNISVDTVEVSEDEYEVIELRKKAKGLKAPIRVVSIDGTDSCTCCGTHCGSTGEVGLLRIDSFARYKGGVRVWFDCGERALTAVRRSREAVETISHRFSVKSEDTVAAVIRQGDELAALKHEMKKRTALLTEYIADELKGGAERCGRAAFVLSMPEGLPANELRTVAERICAGGDTVAVLFAAEGDTLRYQLISGEKTGVSVREICQAVNAAVNGKGGGNDRQAQGSAKLSGGLSETLEQLKTYLRAVLK